jgi:hypothetical protein
MPRSTHALGIAILALTVLAGAGITAMLMGKVVHAMDLVLFSAGTICGIGAFQQPWFTFDYLGDSASGAWLVLGGALILAGALWLYLAALSAREEPEEAEAITRRAAATREAARVQTAALREQLLRAREPDSKE